MEPTLALLFVGWLVSTRVRKAGFAESLLPAVGFPLTMLVLLYTHQFK
jgi:hypothetical protein